MCGAFLYRLPRWPSRRLVAQLRLVAQRRAFSLIEALLALSVMSLAGAVLLLSVQSSLGTTLDAVDQTIADGIAQQKLHEILTKRYMMDGGDPLQSVLSANASELMGPGTSLFDDADDYEGYSAKPLTGIYGEALGTGNDGGSLRLQSFRLRSDFFQNWRIRTNVDYVSATDHAVKSNTPTYFRVVEVTVDMARTGGAMLPLASRKRVLAFVPPPP